MRCGDRKKGAQIGYAPVTSPIGMTRPAGILRPLLLVALLIAWLALPLVLGVARGIVHDRWMLQETPREYGYMVGVTVAWLSPIAVIYFWSTWGHTDWRGLAGLVVWSILSGFVGGQLFLNLTNHSGTALGQPVVFKIVGHERVTVRLRVVGEAYDGITFQCARGKWHDHYHGQAGTFPGLVYRSRLEGHAPR